MWPQNSACRRRRYPTPTYTPTSSPLSFGNGSSTPPTGLDTQGPDPVAAGLRRGRVGAIGVAYDNRLSYAFDDPTTSALLAGITTVAEAAGAGLLLLHGVVRPATPLRRRHRCGDRRADRLLRFRRRPLLRTVIIRRLPLVVIDQPSPDRLAELGAATAPGSASRPGRRGHRRRASSPARTPSPGGRLIRALLGKIGGIRRSGRPGCGELRRYPPPACRLPRAAERHGIDWPAVPVWAGTDSTADQGDAGASAVLARTPRPTALLCLSDRLAEGAVRPPLGSVCSSPTTYPSSPSTTPSHSPPP